MPIAFITRVTDVGDGNPCCQAGLIGDRLRDRSKVIENVGFAIVIAGGLISLGALMVAGSTSLGSNERNMAMESQFIGFLFMILGSGVILSPIALGSQTRSWLSILAFTVLVAGVLMAMGVLALPKLIQVPSNVLEMLYNSVLWFGFWLSLLGVGISIWSLRRKEESEPVADE